MFAVYVPLREFDRVILSGKASSPSWLALNRLPCTVATISPANADDPAALKVWPDDEALASGEEKVWIYLQDITELTVLSPFQGGATLWQEKPIEIE